MSAYWLRVDDEGGMIFEVTANGGINFGPSYKPEKVLAVLNRAFNGMLALGHQAPTDSESVLFHVYHNLTAGRVAVDAGVVKSTEEKKDGTI